MCTFDIKTTVSTVVYLSNRIAITIIATDYCLSVFGSYQSFKYLFLSFAKLYSIYWVIYRVNVLLYWVNVKLSPFRDYQVCHGKNSPPYYLLWQLGGFSVS